MYAGSISSFLTASFKNNVVQVSSAGVWGGCRVCAGSVSNFE